MAFIPVVYKNNKEMNKTENALITLEATLHELKKYHAQQADESKKKGVNQVELHHLGIETGLGIAIAQLHSSFEYLFNEKEKRKRENENARKGLSQMCNIIDRK